mmetsp:Transcript_26097/g.76121  ORF Transcript_26097/g.76121 Transcript_26097/m.76121 type:complete len:252 (+) Transcript_26097:458-1213(+)
MDGPVGFVQGQLVAAANEDGAGLPGVCDARNLDHPLGPTGHGDFGAKFSRAELVRCEGVHVRDGETAQSAGDKVHIVPLHVGDDHDAHLSQEVERQVVVGIPQDGFLDKQHRAAGLLNLLAQSENVLALFTKDTVHGCVVTDDDIVLHVRLGCRQAELDEADLGVLYTGGAAGGLLRSLVEDEPVHELCVVDRASDLLDNANVVQVNVDGGRWVDDGQDRVDGDRGENIRVLVHDLGRQARVHGAHHGVPV